MRKINDEKSIEKYQEIIDLFNTLFNKVNYCSTNCPREKINNQIYSCCVSNCFELDDSEITNNIFINQRNTTAINLSSLGCTYNNSESGCTIPNYKSPMCVSYACEDLQEYLKNTYNIEYIYDEDVAIKSKLLHTLNGTLVKVDFNNLKNVVQDWIKRVENIQDTQTNSF
jgi:hypothetical protein